ncbi:cache domain-containing protein [Lentzea tibetensis]|uniref:cache domain-containing protein n=1 Tax=Lentzea tibetensis TaxID=2591470 RepID=UPI001F38EC9D|nr:cache and HAMP domain-containing protein [Lentzea tibetensis]
MEQIPESGFPSGVKTPSAVLLVMLLALAGLCAFLVRTNDNGAVPGAFVQSQERLVDGLSRSVAATAAQGVNDLRTAAAAKTVNTEALLGSHPQWRGVALLDGATTVSAHGEPVPADAVSAKTDASVTPVPGPELRMVVAVKLPDDSGRVLVATMAAGVPFAPLDAGLRQGLVLLDREGHVVGTRGTAPTKETASEKLLGDAARADQVGSAVVENGDKHATVVAHAPVTSESLNGALGLSVAAVSEVPLTTPVSRWPGLLPAAALALIALIGFALIRKVLVGPVLRLREDALAIAGGDLDHRVRTTRCAEANRIALAVRQCQSALRRKHSRKSPRARRYSAALAVVIAATGVLAWSAAVAVTSGRGAVLVPNTVVAGSHSLLGGTAEAVRRSINDGLADVRAFAKLNGAQDTESMRAAVEQLAGQSRYRNVSVVDQAGAPLVSSGRDPLRAKETKPSGEGIRLQDATSPVPVLFAHAPLGDGTRLVVAEYDVEHLSNLLRRAPGEVRLVDAELRTIASTHGFSAFEPLRAEALRTSAIDALAGAPTTHVRDVSGSRSVIAARGLDNDLHWAVVSEQPASELDLAGNVEQRGALLVALLGAILALTLFGWHHLVLVRPLRRLADTADRLREGDTGETIFPQRQDQVGTIACCLEICRQALVDGVGRLGVVRRPRGAATDVTELMKPVRV